MIIISKRPRGRIVVPVLLIRGWTVRLYEDDGERMRSSCTPRYLHRVERRISVLFVVTCLRCVNEKLESETVLPAARSH